MFRKLLLPSAVLALLLGATGASAVDALGHFELEGNAVLDASAAPPDDWATLHAGGGSASVFTGVKSDPSPQSIFGGGNKDIQPIAQWSHKAGEVPDKDDLTHAFAASYNADGELVVYFGADRVANAGDAFLGFWFFQQEITTRPDGSFDGVHSAGDALVLVNFPQSANAVPEIAVIEWDPRCTKAASNTPSPGQCAAQNLRLLLKGAGSAGAVCGSVPSGALACAVANEATEDAPWPYTSKDGFVNEFPFETLFEGGANLTALLGGDACFASFMAETRSSSSFTASLKDFSLDSFPVCKIGITKQCTDGDVNANETAFVYTYSGTVTNEGFGTVYDVTVTDKGVTFPLGTLAAQQSKSYGGTFESSLNPATNQASVTAAQSPGGAAILTDQTEVVTCPAVDRDPLIGVTKECSTSLVEKDGHVVVSVSFSGQVCNETGTNGVEPIGLKNVTVSDDHGTITSPATGVIGNLAPNTCKPYSGSYLPTSNQAVFSDTVTASGTANLGFGSISETASANCEVCPAP